MPIVLIGSNTHMLQSGIRGPVSKKILGVILDVTQC